LKKLTLRELAKNLKSLNEDLEKRELELKVESTFSPRNNQINLLEPTLTLSLKIKPCEVSQNDT